MKTQQVYYTYDKINLKWKHPSEVILLINEAMIKYGEDNIEFICELNYLVEDVAEVFLNCKRKMTKKEIEKEIERERKNKLTFKELEYEKYLELKKIYETGNSS